MGKFKRFWWNQTEPSQEIVLQYLIWLALQAKIDLKETRIEGTSILIGDNYELMREPVEVHAFGETHITAEHIEYSCGRIVYDPGVSYYRDGSGEPPSTDYDEIMSSPNFRETCQKLLAQIVADRLTYIATADTESEWGSEYE